MSSVHLDPADFEPIIESAVNAALRRLQAEKPTDQTGRILLSKIEAAEALSISVATLDRITAPRGALRCVRLSGRVLYSPAAIRSWIASQEAEGDCHE